MNWIDWIKEGLSSTPEKDLRDREAASLHVRLNNFILPFILLAFGHFHILIIIAVILITIVWHVHSIKKKSRTSNKFHEFAPYWSSANLIIAFLVLLVSMDVVNISLVIGISLTMIFILMYFSWRDFF